MHNTGNVHQFRTTDTKGFPVFFIYDAASVIKSNKLSYSMRFDDKKCIIFVNNLATAVSFAVYFSLKQAKIKVQKIFCHF